MFRWNGQEYSQRPVYRGPASSVLYFSEQPDYSCWMVSLVFRHGEENPKQTLNSSIMKDWSTFGVTLWVHLQSFPGLSLSLLPPTGYASIRLSFWNSPKSTVWFGLLLLKQDGNFSLGQMRSGLLTHLLCKLYSNIIIFLLNYFDACLFSLRCIPANVNNGTAEDDGSLSLVVLTWRLYLFLIHLMIT